MARWPCRGFLGQIPTKSGSFSNEGQALRWRRNHHFPTKGPGSLEHGPGLPWQNGPFQVQGPGFRVQGLGFKDHGPGFRVQGLGQGLGSGG